MRHFIALYRIQNLLSSEVADQELKWNVLNVSLVNGVTTFGPDCLGIGFGQVLEEIANIFFGSLVSSAMLAVSLSLITLQVETGEFGQALAGLVGALIYRRVQIILGCASTFLSWYL